MTDNIKTITIFGIIFSIFFITYILVSYMYSSEITNDINADQYSNVVIDTASTTMKKLRKRKPVQHIQQPICLKMEYFNEKLIEIIHEIQLRRTQCTPCQKIYYEEMWSKQKLKSEQLKRYVEKVDEITENESRGTGVVWCVVGLLIISMIASMIDVFNAKKPRFKKASSFDIAGKPGAAPRRCSLASLTVSRHTRRQQYISKRPSSIAESPPKNTSSNTQQAAGRRESIWQRSSSPSGSTGDLMIALQKESNMGDSEEELSASPDRLHRRIRIIRRF